MNNTKEYMRAWHKRNPGKSAGYARKFRKLHPERTRELEREYDDRNKEKVAAHDAVQHAVKTGKLERGTCEICGEGPGEAHHKDYAEKLIVIWLCRRCHKMFHREVASL